MAHKTKANAMHVYEVRLWSKVHFKGKNETVLPEQKKCPYRGVMTSLRTGNYIWFNYSPADFLKATEMLYEEDEADRTKTGDTKHDKNKKTE